MQFEEREQAAGESPVPDGSVGAHPEPQGVR